MHQIVVDEGTEPSNTWSRQETAESTNFPKPVRTGCCIRSVVQPA